MKSTNIFSKHLNIKTTILITLAIVTLLLSKTNILIVGRDWNGELNKWKSHLEGLGDVDVTIKRSTPSDLSNGVYDQVWYADFKNWGNGGTGTGTFEEPSDIAVNALLPSYLKSGGHIALLTDHDAAGSNPGAKATHTHIETYIKKVTGRSIKIEKTWGWTKSKIEVIDDARLNIDSALIAKMQAKTYYAEFHTGILPTNIGSGIGALKCKKVGWNDPAEVFVGVAFVGESFLPEYQKGGRSFVFTDIYNALADSSNYDILELIAAIAGGKDLTRSSIDLDTNGVNIPSGREVYYEKQQGEDFFATVKVDSGVKIEYLISGTSRGSDLSSPLKINFKNEQDSVELKIRVSGQDILPDSAIWTFIRKKEGTIKLDTTSSGSGLNKTPSVTTFKSTALPIFITSNGNAISYKINGGPKKSYNTSFNLSTISDDTITIEVTAGGGNVIETTESWKFIRDLPEASIVASPSVETPNKYTYNTPSLKVDLKVKVDGKSYGVSDSVTIWYTTDGNLDTNSGTTIKLSQNDSAIITGSDTLKVMAKLNFAQNPQEGKWYYEKNLDVATLTATPSSSPNYSFGHSLKIILESNADTIRYTTDGSTPTKSSTLFVQGRDTIVLGDAHPDTVTLKGFAYGGDLDSTQKEWVYIRDTLPKVIANPKGKKFSSKLSIVLDIEGGINPNWSNFKIYYTTDGSKPNKNSKIYSDTIKINSSTTIKAIAYSDNLIESPITTEIYSLTAAPSDGWYFDRDGDGRIDEAAIKFDKDINNNIDSIVLWSPFNPSEKVVAHKSDIKIESNKRMVISLPTPFEYSQKTGFTKALYGYLEGTDFGDSTELVLGDSVAPLIVSATYAPGKLVGAGVRETDTLIVEFSEEITISNPFEPFEFKRDTVKYRITFDSDNTNGSSSTLLVKDIAGVTNPMLKDSIHIKPSGDVKDSLVAQVNPKNIWIELNVKEPPYSISIEAISPVNPDSFTIPSAIEPKIYKEPTASLVIVDFYTKLWSSDALSAKAKILDVVGNVVAETNTIGDGEHLISELIDTDVTKIVFYWDGKNSNSRRVSTGNYLYVITVVTSDGKVVEKILHIGVKGIE